MHPNIVFSSIEQYFFRNVVKRDRDTVPAEIKHWSSVVLLSLNKHTCKRLDMNRCSRVGPEEVQPRQLRDIWIEKIRQLLLTQETILQQRK